MTTQHINRDPLADLNMGQGPDVLPEGSRHEPEGGRPWEPIEGDAAELDKGGGETAEGDDYDI
ncbi:hypothetical protein N802_11955 [Knoellia sinensis KCTC 19936]|uniref:Uncharacterized protein n=1 Tax=Knoellia sinensis KCTC 19936 TaxID=1385520 RepID=A0A0A0JAA1_9MICO|nr:hypothetical protein [Knoellia sinensis]KGN34375.1 hypothetical protein N802_11955 [Knoellia sinensis KCTC 19936]